MADPRIVAPIRAARRLLPALVAGALLLCAAPAAAAAAAAEQAPDARFPAGGPSATAAWQLAVTYWGATPCNGQVQVSWTRLESGVNATAYWYNPFDAWNNAQENFNCRIEFNVGMEFDWVKFCSVFAHEVGHLLGRQHDEADDLMASYYRAPLDPCEQMPDPTGPAPAPAPAETPEPAEREAAASAATQPRRPAIRIAWADGKRYGKHGPNTARTARVLKRRSVQARRCVVLRKGRARRRVRTLRCHAGTLRPVARAARHAAR